MLIKIASAIGSLFIALGSIFCPTCIDKPNLGSSPQIPSIVALFSTSLQSGITKTDTSMTLVSGTVGDGSTLNGYYGFIIDEGTAQQEFILGTASSTSVTSITRGVSLSNPNSTSSTLTFAHRRGASVKITNYPQLAILSRIINGQDTFPNKLTYASEPTFSAGTDIVDKTYADSLSFIGAPNASTIQKGIIQIATSAQVAAGTSTGSTGALLVAPNSIFSPTSSATIIVPVTSSGGKLAQGFLDLTQAFTFSGATSLTSTLGVTATSTFTGNSIFNGNLLANGSANTMATTTFSVIPTLPATTPTVGTQAVNKTYVDSFPYTFQSGVFTKDFSTSTTTTITHGLGRTPTYVQLEYVTTGGSGTYKSKGAWNGSTYSTIYCGLDASVNTYNCASATDKIAYYVTSSSGDYNKATLSVSSTTLTLTWTKVGSPSGTGIFLWQAY